MENEKIIGAVENILFMAGEAIEIAELAQALGISKEELQQILQTEMKVREKGTGLLLKQFADRVQLCTRPEYAELGRSQLEEMLKLPDTDRQMIQPETSREDIRELKRFNKTEPAAGVADDISQLVEKFYQDNELILNAVYGEEFDEQTINKFIEIVNPAGNRSYKKGLYFMMKTVSHLRNSEIRQRI